MQFEKKSASIDGERARITRKQNRRRLQYEVITVSRLVKICATKLDRRLVVATAISACGQVQTKERLVGRASTM